MRILPLVASLFASAAAANPAPPPMADTRVLLNTFSVFRANPIGLEQQATLTWRKRLSSSEELLWSSQHLALGAMAGVNPANVTAHAFAVLEPIAVFNLKVGADYRRYLGMFGNIISSTDPELSLLSADLKAAERGQYGGGAYSVYAEPVLQAKVGPVAIRNALNVSYRSASLTPGHVAYYEPGLDLRLPREGVLVQNTALVLYLGGKFVAGLRYDLQTPLALPGNDVHRAGVLMAWTFWDNGPSMWNKGTLVTMVHWALKHPAARERGLLPTAVIGFSTESDLLK